MGLIDDGAIHCMQSSVPGMVRNTEANRMCILPSRNLQSNKRVENIGVMLMLLLMRVAATNKRTKEMRKKLPLSWGEVKVDLDR